MTAGTRSRVAAAGVIISACVLASCKDTPTDLKSTTEDAGGATGAVSLQGSNKPRFIVTLADRQDPRAVAAQYGVQPDRVYTHVIDGFAGSISDAAKEGLLKDARVISVERDVEIRHQDVGAPQQNAPWDLDRIDQRENALDGFYAYGTTGAGVTAYIVDSGIRYSHTEFGGRAHPGFDAFGEDGSDCYGHGTHVAGLVGGSTYGVAKAVDLVSVRVMNCGGWGNGSDLIAGMDWIMANRHGPAVANMSLAFYTTSNIKQSVFDQAVQNLIASGVTVVAAAANYAADACDYTPARVPEAITVGATGPSDTRSSFSNFGRCVDLFAPGEGVVSASYASDDGTAVKSGTSMAAPLTAGVAALFLERAPTASPSEVADTLLAWTTKSIVQDANSRNDYLLFSPVATQYSPSNQPPSAAFSYACDSLACQFTDNSSDVDGAVVSWSWSFGSSGVSQDANPSFTFGGAGTYTVSLTVTDDDGATSTTAQNVKVGDLLSLNQPPTAEFSFTCTELSCQFTDQSADPDGSVVSWSWSFAADAQSVDPNPSYIFPSAGTYSVSLTVTDNEGSQSTSTQQVAVSAPSPSGIQLSALPFKSKGLHQVELDWSGAAGTAVDVYQDGVLALTVPNSGSYLMELSERGKATYRFRICEAATTTCSSEVAVTF